MIINRVKFMEKRIFAFIIDIWITAIAFIPVVLYSMIFKTSDVFVSIAFIIMHSLLICKDLLFRNRSIGKRLCKLVIVNDSGTKPSEFQLVLRNIFSMFWIVELFIMFINKKHKKIGDFICSTKVVNLNEEENSQQLSLNRKSLFGSVLFALVYSSLIVVILYSLLYSPKFQVLFL